jgi:L-amino acid N-acyltransferase YncA
VNSVRQKARGLGIGTKLLAALVNRSEGEGIRTPQAGIFPENVTRAELHKNVGFRIGGVREKLRSMDGKWHDVLLLDRRGRVSGI